MQCYGRYAGVREQGGKGGGGGGGRGGTIYNLLSVVIVVLLVCVRVFVIRCLEQKGQREE